MTYAERMRTCTDDELADLLMQLGLFSRDATSVRRELIVELLHTQYDPIPGYNIGYEGPCDCLEE